jgi:hypothetical protein
MTISASFYVARDRNVYERGTHQWLGTLFPDHASEEHLPMGWNALCSYSGLYSKCGPYLCQPDRTPRRRDALADLIRHHHEVHSK